MDVVVRPARPADADAIARVQTEGWRRGYAGLLPENYLDQLSLDAARRRWRSQLAHADRTTDELVAVVGPGAGSGPAGPDGGTGGVAGIAVVGPSADPDAPRDGSVGELFALYVDGVRWGAGLGHALHVQAMAVLRRRGFARATLWMLRGNARAGAFYARQGWRGDHLMRTDDRGDVRLVEVRLTRGLTSADGPTSDPSADPDAPDHPPSASG